jgi:hypothetical protein
MNHLTFRVVLGRCWNLGPIQKVGTWCDSFTVLLTSSNRIETSYKPVCGKQAKRNCVCEKPAAETNLHATNCLSASVRHSPLPHVNIVQSLSDLSKHIRGLQWRHQGFNIYKAQNRNDGNDGNDRNHTTELTKYDQLWSNHITYAKVLCGYMCVFHCFPLYWRLRLT